MSPSALPVTSTRPVSVTVRTSRQRTEQTTSLTFGGSGVPMPPSPEAAATQLSSAASVANAARLIVLGEGILVRVRAAVGLKSSFSFVRAYGVSCRARAERAALPGLMPGFAPWSPFPRRSRLPCGSPAPRRVRPGIRQVLCGRQYIRGAGHRETGFRWRLGVVPPPWPRPALRAGPQWLSSAGRVGPVRVGTRLFRGMKTLRSHTREPPARLVRRRRRGPDPGPSRDPDRRCPARQAQARVHAALRRRRLRRRRQRREDRRHRRQAEEQAVLPAQRLPGRDPLADPRGDARPQARGRHPPRRQGDASPQQAGPQAAAQAQGLRRARPSPRRAAAASPWR